MDHAYDAYGRMTQLKTYRQDLTAPDVTVWAYDEASGLLASKTYADANSVSYAYTMDGKLSTRTWSRGVVTTYSYNSTTGDLTGVSYSDSTPAVTIAYSRLGQKTTVTDAVGSRTFGYNGSFDLTSEAITGIYNKTISRTYDSLGRASGMEIGTEYNVGYGYDALGRFNALTNGGDNFAYSYLANSNLVSGITYPNGITSSNSFEANRDLITSVEGKFGTTSVGKYDYVNDAIGRRTSMGKSGSAFAQADTLTYSYNSKSEVTSAVAQNETAYNYAFNFDNIGNRITATERGTSFNYAANALNQYSAVNTANPAYDVDGNMTANTNGWTYTWDAENRLATAVNGTQTLQFKYDYMSRRVEKEVLSGSTVTKQERYVYDNFKQIEKLDALNSNELTQKFIWAGERLLSVDDTSTSYYAMQDANKNITELIDGNGAVAAHYEYSPFGKVTVANGAYASSNPYRFSSEFADDEMGLVYYNYRYYSPDLVRWLGRDIIEEAGGVNLYAYISNKTINKWDVNGMSWVDAIPIVGTGRGLIIAKHVDGSTVYDYSGRVTKCECARERDITELNCQRSISNQAKKYDYDAIAMLGVKTGVDLTGAMGGFLAKNQIGLIVTGVSLADGVLGGYAIQLALGAIAEASLQAMKDYCNCSQYDTK